MRIPIVLFVALLTIPFAVAQQNQSAEATPENTKQAATKKDKKAISARKRHKSGEGRGKR